MGHIAADIKLISKSNVVRISSDKKQREYKYLGYNNWKQNTDVTHGLSIMNLCVEPVARREMQFI